MRKFLIVAAGIGLMNAAAVSAAAPPPQSVEAKLAALKTSMAKNQAALRHYSWVETTTVSYKGEVKSTRQATASFLPDGTVQKVPIGAPPQQQTESGLRGRIKANKVEEMTDYMKSAVALVKTYVPPQPTKLQAVKTADKVSLTMAPAGAATLNFAGYEKPGDNLAITIEPAASRITGINVASYLDDPSQPVTLVVAMASLPDGTSHVGTTTLNAPAKSLSVSIANSNYKKIN